mmetsp:Transcript_31854/g.59372  ORF Transcript_31854/g.59372 Transcript_31854/m.59372 type:complete len:80 (+) Transcript_31854:376-615(+)
MIRLLIHVPVVAGVLRVHSFASGGVSSSVLFRDDELDEEAPMEFEVSATTLFGSVALELSFEGPGDFPTLCSERDAADG